MPIDYSKYPKNWKLISLFIRRYRADWKCEFCGAKNGLPNPKTGSKVVLTVAHLDHDVKNNSFFNLKALCQKCHLNYDQAQHIHSRKERRLKGQFKLSI